MNLNYKKVLEKAEEYKPDMSKFLREMIAIPSRSGQEKEIILRIKEEMTKVGFDQVRIDPMGNILGYIGEGKHLIAMDAHVDTVGVGEEKLWEYDPYEGYEDEEIVFGRGASDQKGGMASLVYAGKIIKELHLEDDYTLLVTGTVQEEDCDGLCWQYLIQEEKIKPEFVVITEPTSGKICRGQRGRMEIKVTTEGISCHGSVPEKGDNAIYKMTPILKELSELNKNLKEDNFLGKGSLAVTEIFSESPSRCSIPDKCTISIDRRLVTGETWEEALEQIKGLASVKGAGAEASVYSYAYPSYTGLVYPAQNYFPTWVLEEEHPVCQTLVEVHKGLFGEEPLIDKWAFSTNGVSIMGRYDIPCVGFGPGQEDQAHVPNEKTWKKELVKAAAMYVTIPIIYVSNYL